MPSFTPGTMHKYSFPVNSFAVNANDITQIVFGNTRRIALGIYSLTPDLVIYPSTIGIVLSQISPYQANRGGFWYLASEVGSLCQIDWYAYTVIGGAITILEVVEES
jgi:hypothetical protein